jgi:hypothetical protein
LNLLANRFVQLHLVCARARGRGTCRFVVVDWKSYERERDARRALIGMARLANDLAAVIHIVGENQKRRTGHCKRIQVKCLSVLPQRSP